MTLYIENVDHAGHSYGPVAPELDDQLVIADQVVGFFMEGLKIRGLQDCVNIIIVADHGMAPISCERKNSVEDYGVDADFTYIRSGAFGRIGKSKDQTEWPQFNAEDINEGLRCHHEESHWNSYIKYEYLPKRFHYANNDRIEDVIAVVDDAWLLEGRKGSYSSCNGGTHGFDNEFKSMHALFAAHGPAFKTNFNTTEAFENIELYNMMADILGIEAAPNNGTHGSLNFMLNQPRNVDPFPEGVAAQDDCPYEAVGVDVMECTPCTDQASHNDQLNLDAATVNEFQQQHLLYGVPNAVPPGTDLYKYCLLTHQDYVSAYERIRMMPLYVSYTVKPLKSGLRTFESLGACARSDPRVPIPDMTACADYGSEVEYITMYPEALSTGEARYDAKLTTNLVAIYPPAKTVFDFMTRKLDEWARGYGGVHVTSGPVFDYNFDGHADDMNVVTEHNPSGSPYVPTHFFFVITRCQDFSKSVDQCLGVDEIDVLSYIIPNYKYNQCGQNDLNSTSWVEESIREHVARVRDVELITGINFLTSLMEGQSEEKKSEAIRLRLQLPQFDSDWFGEVPTMEPGTDGGNSANVQKASFTSVVLIACTLFLLKFF